MKNIFTSRSDSDILEEIIKNAENGIAVIPQRISDVEPERTHWLIDRAILIPSDTTVILRNCKIKLSDKCRDNFFRSANCGMGITDIKPAKNIRIIGDGFSVLEGADHPRSTGDSSKQIKCPCYKNPEDIARFADWIPEERRSVELLSFWDSHAYSYGTDANVPGEKHTGDWRNVGILFACVENFAIENLTITESHGWGISLEACSYGQLKNITFDAKMQREIDGILHNIENQDGIDLRNGCHDITLTDIKGQTGDDLIALTAFANPNTPFHESGSLESMHIMHNDWENRDRDIYNVIIRNAIGRSQGGSICKCCSMIRLLPISATIRNVIIDGVINFHEDGLHEERTLLFGEGEGCSYGEILPNGLHSISVSNIICDSIEAISVCGFLTNSTISNVINKNPSCEPIKVYRKNGMRNVATSNLITLEN